MNETPEASRIAQPDVQSDPRALSKADVLVTLLRRGLTQLDQWQKKYGEHNPAWLPPAGDVRWAEDVAEALAVAAIPPQAGLPSSPSMFNSLQVTAMWQDFCRSHDYRQALEWASRDEAPGALFVAFRSGLAAALAASPAAAALPDTEGWLMEAIQMLDEIRKDVRDTKWGSLQCDNLERHLRKRPAQDDAALLMQSLEALETCITAQRKQLYNEPAVSAAIALVRERLDHQTTKEQS